MNTGTEEHSGWRNSIGGSRIKMLKMLGVVGGLFKVCFLSLSMWKTVSLFPKQVKMLEVQKLSKLSIVRYTIAIVIYI